MATAGRAGRKVETLMVMMIDEYLVRGASGDAAEEFSGSQSLANKLASKKQTFFDAILTDNTDVTRRVIADHLDAIIWRDADGLTGLMAAAKTGARETAQELLAAGASTAIQNTNGSTALIFAAFAGKATVVEALLNAGDDANHANYEGKTPLMMAAAYGFRNTLSLLLDHGADPGMKDKAGLTALDYAQDNDCGEVAAILRQRMGLPPGLTGKAGDEFDAIGPENTDVKALAAASSASSGGQGVCAANDTSLKSLELKMGKAKLF